MQLTKDLLKNFIRTTKNEYPNVIEHLKLNLEQDGEGAYIYIVLIKIKKNSTNKGYGTIIMKKLVDFAKEYDIRIKLWATCAYGSNLLRLIKFYKRFGFKQVSKHIAEEMIYKPKKIKITTVQ